MENLTATDAHYGHAMRSLNERQRLFVFSKVWKGATQRQAALDAGYSASSLNVLDVQAHALANHPNVMAAIREETEKLRDAEGAASFRVLAEIRDDPTTEKKDRIRAAVELLNRSGYQAMTEHKVTVMHTDATNDEMIKRIEHLARGLGIDPKKLLGNCIDADYEELPSNPPHELTEAEKKEKARRDRENELRRARRKMTPEQLATHKQATRQKYSKEARQIYHHEQHRQDYGNLTDVNIIAANVDDDLSDLL